MSGPSNNPWGVNYIQCRSCKRAIEDTSNFCEHCGFPVRTSPPPPPNPPVGLNPGHGFGQSQVHVHRTPSTQQRNKVIILCIAIPLAIIAVAVAVFLLLNDGKGSPNDGLPPVTPSPAVNAPSTGNNDDIITPVTPDNSTPDPSTPAPPETPSGQQTDTPQDTPAPAVNTDSINIDALQMIGKTNLDLIAINGINGDAFIMDGFVYADYTRQRVLHPLCFLLEIEGSVFMDYVLGDERFPRDMNLWPEDSIVSGIVLWNDPDIKHVFRATGPVTHEVVVSLTNADSGLSLLSMSDQYDEIEQYGFDVWTSVFWVDCYELYAVFKQEGNDLVLFEMWIWESYT